MNVLPLIWPRSRHLLVLGTFALLVACGGRPDRDGSTAVAAALRLRAQGHAATLHGLLREYAMEQEAFSASHNRYATIAELEAAGFPLDTTTVAIDSTAATATTYFLRLRDRATQTTCRAAMPPVDGASVACDAP